MNFDYSAILFKRLSFICIFLFCAILVLTSVEDALNIVSSSESTSFDDEKIREIVNESVDYYLGEE